MNMRILIVRHADPDYVNDSITKKGVKEAKLLAERLKKEKIDAIYCSPLGRAKKTASYTLNARNECAETFEWLREFGSNLTPHGSKICWDRMPSEWTKNNDFYDADKWYGVQEFQEFGITKEYEFVKKGLFDLLSKYGYENNGKYFKVKKANKKTIVLFCHFGVESVILSLLFGTSAMPFLHNFCALPSSVTTVVTEERERGVASFRCLSFGDISHLYAGSEKPSFQARFCETYSDFTKRH